MHFHIICLKFLSIFLIGNLILFLEWQENKMFNVLINSICIVMPMVWTWAVQELMRAAENREIWHLSKNLSLRVLMPSAREEEEILVILVFKFLLVLFIVMFSTAPYIDVKKCVSSALYIFSAASTCLYTVSMTFALSLNIFS